MKLRDYANQIQQLVTDGHGNLTVFYSCDDEGNAYSEVCHIPTVVSKEEFDIGSCKGKCVLIN